MHPLPPRQRPRSVAHGTRFMADDRTTGELQRLRRLHSIMKVTFGLSAMATTFVLACSTAYLVMHYGATQSVLVFIIAATASTIILLHVIQAILLRKVTGEIESKIALLVLYDDLTGVYNYRYLEQRIDQEIVRSERAGAVLIGPRSLAHEDQIGILATHAEHQVLTFGRQLAALTVAQIQPHLIQGPRWLRAQDGGRRARRRARRRAAAWFS